MYVCVCVCMCVSFRRDWLWIDDFAQNNSITSCSFTFVASASLTAPHGNTAGSSHADSMNQRLLFIFLCFAGQRQRVRGRPQPTEDPLFRQPLHQRPHLLQLLAAPAERHIPGTGLQLHRVRVGRPGALRPAAAASSTSTATTAQFAQPPASAGPGSTPGSGQPVQAQRQPDSHPLPAELQPPQPAQHPLQAPQQPSPRLQGPNCWLLLLCVKILRRTSKFCGNIYPTCVEGEHSNASAVGSITSFTPFFSLFISFYFLRVVFSL